MTSITKEALKLALEALHGFIPYLPLNDEEQCGRYDKAIIAIKEALAQPEQEPVANEWSVFNTGAEVASGLSLSEAWDYLTPERLERGWSAVCVLNKDNQPTFPPQRKPLSLEDLERLHFKYAKYQDESMGISGWVEYARAIEAAHGIKGEA